MKNQKLPELRRDFLTGLYVLISPSRANRPDENILEEKKRSTISSRECPICPGNEHLTPQPELYAKLINGEEKIKRNDIGPNWLVRVVPNKFPLLMIEGEANGNTDLIFTSMSGVGAHEIIVDHRDHHAQIHNFSQDDIKNLIRAASCRYADLGNDPRFKYCLLFKNSQKEAGASLSHSHSQIVIFPFVPPKSQIKIQAFRDYNDRFGKCILCDYLERELNEHNGIRLIEKNEHFAAIAPYASEWSYKIMIAPISHHPSWANQLEDFRILDAFSSILLSSMQKLNKAKNDMPCMPYNMIWFNSPYTSSDTSSKLHWHLEIMPRLHPHGGVELAAGVYANSLSPEEAAKKLRAVKTK